MALSPIQGSKVIVQEINLSQIIVATSSSVASQIVVSNQGATVPINITNNGDYLSQYGNPNAQIGFDIYCGLDYLSEGNNLWSLRVVGEGAMYSAILMWTNGSDTYLSPIADGIPDPANPDWTGLLPPGNNEAIALFYASKGPGSYGDNIALSVTSVNLTQPQDIQVTSSDTGGNLPAATYQYQVSAISATGETLASQPVEIVIAGAQVTNSNTITWDIQTQAIGYKVYGRTQDSVGYIATIGQGTNSFIDTGAIAPDTTQLPITDESEVTTSPVFNVNVFDTTISTQNAVEMFDSTLLENTSSAGIETELEQRINPYSNYIRVTSNVPALFSIPVVNSSPLTVMAGGDSGAAPTSYDIAGAWSTFSDNQLYPINIQINGGHSDPTVQLAMDSLAQSRGDLIGMLDVPSADQKFQDAINYRNLQLNLNSSYSALFCPDVLEADTINGKQQYVPFSGWAAALCARTDRVANPSFSIAGLNRGLINVLKTRYTYDQGEMDSLFAAQVNYTMVGQGISLWEQQTLSSEFSALSWISVRRITNVIKTSLYKFLLYSLQEPNDDFLGRQIVGACSSYLQAIQNARGLSGFSVISDSSNNSAQDFNSGIRNVAVIIIPTIPTHLINLQVAISKQGVSFTEALSQINPG